MNRKKNVKSLNSVVHLRSLKQPVLLPLMLFIALFALSSDVGRAQENFKITNYFSQKYRDFQMMKISIIPPSTFAKDTDQVGFLDPANAAAIRAEEIKSGVHAVTQSFLHHFDSTGRYDSLGLKLLEEYPFTINGFETHLTHLSGMIDGEEYSQWWMFVGDTSDTYVIKGYIPEQKKHVLEQPMRTALLSVFYEPDRRLIPPGNDGTWTTSSSCSCHNQK